MSVRGIYRGKTPIGNATPTNAPIYVDSDDNALKVVPAGSGSTEKFIPTADRIQNIGTVITPTAATELTAAQSGSIVFLNAAAGFAITLPLPAAGLRYRFIVAAAFATSSFTVVTNGSANIIQGVVDVNSTLVPGADEDTITFVNSAETVGDWVEVVSDGTNWYVSGQAAASGGVTLTQTP